MSLIVLGQLGMIIMPSSDEGTISVSVTLPQGTKLEDTDAMSKKVENIIAENGDVDTIFSSVGSEGATSAIMGAGANTSTITVTLNDKRKKSTDDVSQDIRDMLKNISGAEIAVSASSTGMSSMASKEVQFRFSGNDDKQL